jgi:hypothetical protein
LIETIVASAIDSPSCGMMIGTWGMEEVKRLQGYKVKKESCCGFGFQPMLPKIPSAGCRCHFRSGRQVSVSFAQ